MSIQSILNGSLLNKRKKTITMRKERDEESGKYLEQYPEEDFLSAISELDKSTTQNVADEVGCSYDLAYRRLKDLERESEISSEEIGGSLLWQSD